MLFTSLFSSFAIIEKSIENSTMRASGGNAHGTYKNLTYEQYETISQSKRIKQISYSIFLAFAENDAFKKHDTEITYVNSAKEAEARFSMPTEGRLPEKSNEIATDTTVLDLLGVSANIGEKVEITYTLGDDTYTDTFMLVGFWDGDSVAPTSQIFISKSYLNQVLDTASGYDENVGKLNADVFFNSSFGIEGNMQKVLEECGFDDGEIEFGVNPAYMGNSDSCDLKTVLAAIATMLMIMLCGYLMISNVFYISITKDIRYYGLLKSIGTTSKQIKSIIHSYAMYICLIGVPPGLVAGYAVSEGMIPSFLNVLSTDTIEIDTDLNPIIFVISAVFAVITVFISSSRAVRRATKISPTEAVRLSDTQNGKLISRHKKRLGLTDIAFFNVMRNRRKTALVVLSLSLSLVLLNATYSAVSGFNLDKYLSSMISHDFAVASSNYFSYSYDDEGLDEEFIDEISEQDGVKAVEKVYSCEIAEPYVLPDGTSTNVIIYGIDDDLFDLITINSGEIDVSENMTIVSVTQYGSNEDLDSEAYFNLGDKISLNISGTEYNSAVTALGTMPYNLSRRYGYLTTLEIIIPSKTYLEITGDSEPMLAVFDVSDDSLSGVETYLSDITADTDYQYESREALKAEFESMRKTISVIGYALSFIVGFLGLSNFSNTVITSIMSRKRETAVLQSLGMTNKQTHKILSIEGLRPHRKPKRNLIRCTHGCDTLGLSR